MAVVQFDVDGVLADFMLGFMQLARQELGSTRPPLTQAEQPCWDSYGGMDPRDVALTWRLVRESPDFWELLPSLVSYDTLERINRLQDQHAVYFTTNRLGRYPKYQTESWLRGRGVESPTVVVTDRKGEFARAAHTTHALEDKAGNAVYIAYESPDTCSFLIDRPYNRFDQGVLGSKVTRVGSVAEFLDSVEAA